MKDISETSASNNTTSLSSEDFRSKAEGIAWCSAFVLEAVFVVARNLLAIVLFALNKKLRKKSLYLIINMACGELFLGAVYLPLYILLIGTGYQLWESTLNESLDLILEIFDITGNVFSQVSLISAAFISGERYYAIYWLLKHLTVSMRAYRIVIFVVRTLSILVSMVVFLAGVSVSNKHAIYFLASYFVTLLFIVCCCNIGIWRKFQQGGIAPLRPI